MSRCVPNSAIIHVGMRLDLRCGDDYHSVVFTNGVMGESMRERGAEICEVVCFNPGKIAALKRRLPPVGDLERQADRLKAVGHPGRLAVLFALARSECCVCDLSHVLGRPVSTVSQHLRILKSAGFVRCRHAGKLVFYSITASASAIDLRHGRFPGAPKREGRQS